MLPRIRNIFICAVIAMLAYFVLWEAERAARRFPRFMLPQWQIRYYVNHIEKSKLVPDEETGFLIPPNQREKVQTPDYTFVRVTDSKGFPNQDPWPNQADIVFLGDSLIVGEGVGLAKSFPHLVAGVLPSKKVVNLGIGAAGPERQYAIYRRLGLGLRPRLAVSCLYLASDFDNDLHFKSWLRQGRNSDYNEYRLHFGQPQNGSQPFDLDSLFERSWLLGMARELVLRSIAGKNRMPDRYSFPNGTEILLNRPTMEFAAEAVAAHDERVESMVKSVEKLRDLVASREGKLLVMLIPSKEELFGTAASTRDLNIVSRTRQRFEAAKLAVLDLYPAILKAGASESPYFTRDIHLNAYGNRIVAEQFVAWFQNQAKGTQPM